MSDPKAEWRWWQIVRERGPDILVRCREDVAADHAHAKTEGLRAFSGKGFVWTDTARPERVPGAEEGSISVDWDTVVGVFHVADAAVGQLARSRREPVSE